MPRGTGFEGALIAAYQQDQAKSDTVVAPNHTWQAVARTLISRIPDCGSAPALLVATPDGDHRINLDGDEVILGRSDECDVHLPYGLVSRRHCRLYHSDGQWMLEDLESANGTLVNGVPCMHKILVGGDILQVGQATILFLPSRTLAPLELAE